MACEAFAEEEFTNDIIQNNAQDAMGIMECLSIQFVKEITEYEKSAKRETLERIEYLCQQKEPEEEFYDED